MKQYLDLLQKIKDEGIWTENRTGIRTKSMNGEIMKFDHADGFPILTTKKMAFQSIVGELLAFLSGSTDVRTFRDLGCNVWNANLDAPEWVAKRKDEFDLGCIYGKQWRDFSGVDQIKNLIDQIKNNPTSRRLIVSAWNPEELDDMCLPPCHVLFQVIIRENKFLDLLMFQRSADFFLGVPYNITSYALLQCILAKLTGYTPGIFTHFLGDLHIYENHMEQVETQLSRPPRALPFLIINPFDNIENLTLEDFNLFCYDPWPAIKAPMAV